IKALLALLIAFPYLMWRFVVALSRFRRWEWLVAHVLTAAVLIDTLLLSDFEQLQDRRSLATIVFIALFLAQWVFLLGVAGIRLWNMARHAAGVAKKRMYTMGAGLFVLAVLLLISAPTSDAPDEEPDAFSLATSALSLVAGPMLLLGFAPPRVVRQIWRSGADQAMHEAEIGIVKALTKSEVAESLLPPAVDLFGGDGAALLDADLEIVGTHRTRAADLASRIETLRTLSAERYVSRDIADAQVVAMENGWLVVLTGPMTPFFASDELQMLSALSVFADLALGRASLYEREFRAREAMRDFVAIASHDLRTPVTVIRGFTQMMAPGFAELTDDQRNEFNAAIERQVTHLDRLVGDLLTVSKLDVEEIEVVPGRVELVTAVRDTVATLADGGVEICGDELVTVSADPEHVVRMLQNYIKNATVYGKPPIVISVRSENAFGVVRVTDRGPGVPDYFVPRLFEKFARVDKKKSRSVQGTGLGLSIVRGLARANRGDAWFEPNEPTGACFAFKLPLAEALGDGEMS
ncbi:MAG: HAMP domain-containing sensor histidine kinase, partial [Actinomycetota bacterium]